MNNGEFYLSDLIDLITEVLDHGGSFRLAPKGTSMLPLLVQGEDSVALRKLDLAQLRRHDIILYKRTNGAFVLHRIMRREKDGSYVMCGDNQLILERGIRPEQMIGYVERIEKKARTLHRNSFRYRIYVFFWCFLPYRRAVMLWKRGVRFLKRKISTKNKD